MSDWINSTFAVMDRAGLEFFHELSETCGSWLTAFMKFISLLGEEGIFLMTVAAIFLLFKKMRPAGVSMFAAIAIGTLITNIALKNLIARPRPFLSGVEDFYEWWQSVGALEVGGFSFPSGHVTSAAACIFAFVIIMRKHKLSLLAIILPVLMSMSRVYFVVHYPSDVIAGMLSGLISAVIGVIITGLIFRFLEKHRDVKLFAFLTDFSVVSLIRSKK